jgi:hypothetical protein
MPEFGFLHVQSSHYISITILFIAAEKLPERLQLKV